MTDDRWREIEELYHGAREHGRHILTDADPELRREVEELLAQESGGHILDSPAAELLPKFAPQSTMVPLAPGQSIGQYRIAEHLGTGGMGTVYRATDTKLGRSVALKMLLPEMLSDATSLARFEREARTLASLNHPKIAAIYGLEEHQNVRFLALEYVPGPTLTERLRRGPLPVREAILISKQIAEALEAAHTRGIMHRDLKPANIKISDTGQVKVLDFGLAKPIERSEMVLADATTPSLIEKLTNSLTIVGTPAYMSPEQVSGRALDARTDIWSFGCVLYESLTGKCAFEAETITEVLAAVVEREPDWVALPAATPEPLRLLLKRCLRKDPNNRLRDIVDARLELEELLEPRPTEAVRKPNTITRRTAIGTISGAVAGAAAGGLFSISRFRGAVPRSLTQFVIAAPEGTTMPSSFGRRVAISPDASHLAFVVNGPSDMNTFYVRALGKLEPRLVVNGGAIPFFSPDGQSLAFLRTGRNSHLAKMPPDGGPAIVVSDERWLWSGTWADDGTIYADLLDTNGLAAIPAAGGSPRVVLSVDLARGERQPKSPCALPGGEAVLLTIANADTETYDDAQIVAFQPRTGRQRVLVEGGSYPRYMRSGHLLFARDGKILAVRFDPDRLRTSGQPITVLEGVQMSRNSANVNYDVSLNGDLAYVPGNCDGGARTLVWVERSGAAKPVGLPPRSYLHPRLSPAGDRLAIEIEGPNHDLYLYDFNRAVLAKITTDGVSHWPVWSPDGAELAFRHGPMGAFKLQHVPVDQSLQPEPIHAEDVNQSPDSWSPDGHELLYTAMGPGQPPHVMVVPIKGGSPRPVDVTRFPEGSPKFSPDGRWIAYCSNESGSPQVYVQAFPGPGTKIQVSSNGGTDPVWKRNGGELYYRNGDSMMAVSVSTTPSFKAAPPEELWKGHFAHGMSSSCGPPGATSSNYDVTADGKRFLMIKDDDEDRAVSNRFVVVLGWAGEVRRMTETA